MVNAVSLFEGIPSSIISDVMRRMGGARTLRPQHRSGGLLGSAYTVMVRSGDNLYIHEALRHIQKGQVLVVDGEGHTDRALVGEIMMSVAQMRGVAGFVINGAIRDSDAFLSSNFPCYAKAVTHQGPFKNGPGRISVPIVVEGAVVSPDDVVVGDADGVVFVPLAQAEDIADRSRKKMELEAAVLSGISTGNYDDSWVGEALQAQLV